jgi:hypothetical protein
VTVKYPGRLPDRAGNGHGLWQLAELDYQLGNLCRPGLSHGLTCGAGYPRVTVRDRSSPRLMAR